MQQSRISGLTKVCRSKWNEYWQWQCCRIG